MFQSIDERYLLLLYISLASPSPRGRLFRLSAPITLPVWLPDLPAELAPMMSAASSRHHQHRVVAAAIAVTSDGRHDWSHHARFINGQSRTTGPRCRQPCARTSKICPSPPFDSISGAALPEKKTCRGNRNKKRGSVKRHALHTLLDHCPSSSAPPPETSLETRQTINKSPATRTR